MTSLSARFRIEDFIADAKRYFTMWGCTQDDIARASHLTKNTITDFMRGKCSTLTTIIGIADAADLRLDDYRIEPDWWTQAQEQEAS